MILRDVEVSGRRVDVRLDRGTIDAMDACLVPTPGEEEMDGGGGALLPGLHDHHLHLLAMAASRNSVDCARGLAALHEAPPGAWIRGFGFPGSVDRHVLDTFVADRPVRVQHRSGALWMLNTEALRRVELDDTADVERGPDGAPTGRLWRYDERLRMSLSSAPPNLQPVVQELERLGITSVTDATPNLDASAIATLRAASMEVLMLGDPHGAGPWKIVLGDHDLPSYEVLATQVEAAHQRGQAIAAHCVTREALLLAIAVLSDVGRVPGDRIEHAAVVPDPQLLHGLRVVTQPAFLLHRGDDYARRVELEDLPHLYRWRSLTNAGVDVLPSSDAPYGPVDPWTVMRAARDRTTPSGRVLGEAERVPVSTSLAGYLRGADGQPRYVRPGEPARLVLLHTSLRDAMADPHRDLVRCVWH